MRKLVVTEFVSLDGVMEDPAWTGQYRSEESAKFKFGELFASDALLLGRITYQGFAQAWPSQKDEEGFADRMNSLPKYVASTTLDKLEWNNSHLLKEDLPGEVASLKQQPGQNILIYGSGGLVESLMPHKLIDEYCLLVFPVILGSGKRFFKDGQAMSGLKLVETRPFGSGVVALTYQLEKP
jgi:dihydrofolate reductase